ncbi:MAG TPA: DUF2934 domain-containing protein [Phycisphaerales bacterium]|nr:DUF2934 domain-containing protein [Phycisphaerales bacterium]
MQKPQRSGSQRNGSASAVAAPRPAANAKPSASFGTLNTNAQFESKPVPAQVSRQAIAEAAYFIWKERGGDSILNWLEAERQLTSTAKR